MCLRSARAMYRAQCACDRSGRASSQQTKTQSAGEIIEVLQNSFNIFEIHGLGQFCWTVVFDAWSGAAKVVRNMPRCTIFSFFRPQPFVACAELQCPRSWPPCPSMPRPLHSHTGGSFMAQTMPLRQTSLYYNHVRFFSGLANKCLRKEFHGPPRVVRMSSMH